MWIQRKTSTVCLFLWLAQCACLQLGKSKSCFVHSVNSYKHRLLPYINPALAIFLGSAAVFFPTNGAVVHCQLVENSHGRNDKDMLQRRLLSGHGQSLQSCLRMHGAVYAPSRRCKTSLEQWNNVCQRAQETSPAWTGKRK